LRYDEGIKDKVVVITGASSGLWLLAGGLAQCRIFSKVLALQIMARELGITI
jgi:NADP-dependent 3-hydroxy acid dehydrogenase YdfG